MKAIFTHKPSSRYDDLPEERYHFPASYINQVEKAINDWIIYYEPRRGISHTDGRQAYFAIARVLRIEKDEPEEGHFYAFVDNYLEFDNPVPFKIGSQYFEKMLQKDDGTTNKGAFGRSVRIISDEEYKIILSYAFSKIISNDTPLSNTSIEVSSSEPIMNVNEEEEEYGERPIIEQISKRKFRDVMFSSTIKKAYQNKCAVSGMNIISHQGHAEVQAAHIKPVSSDGPDSPRNGIALTSTVHWMFDKGLITIDDDYSIIVAKNRLPDTALKLINPNEKIELPNQLDLRPHPRYLKYHREQIFRG
jgi:putative restriction endonuclease